jgi:chorismate-pyruvate lyase
LDEVFALLGATADSFAAASTLLAQLTLVQISPTVVRAATETLGHVLQAEEQRTVRAAWEQGTLPPAVATPAQRSVSLDGVLVHTEAQWREYQLGSVYTTTTRPSTTHPGREEVYAQAISYVGEVAEASDFGQLLWCEAARRGVLTAREVIIIADGAHWIWNLAAEHFPDATQIVDCTTRPSICGRRPTPSMGTARRSPSAGPSGAWPSYGPGRCRKCSAPWAKRLSTLPYRRR